jgi:CheY-like chemotaxis protein
MSNQQPVLYVEDDDNDAFLMQRAFRLLSIGNPLRILSDGKTAIDYLSGAPATAAESPPCLVVLDLSMPGKNGLDVLKWIRNDSKQTDLPVIVLTSSNQESDIHRAFQLKANGFITKPGDSTKLLNIVKAINEYWLSESKPAASFAEFAEAKNVPVLSHASKNGSLPNE